MITSTFCHLPKIGLQKEQNIWEQGIHNWGEFITAQKVQGISQHKKSYFDRQLKSAKKAIFQGNSSYFNVLPRNEQWRLWPEYKEEACYIDIETNYQNEITVLGISDGEQTWQFVKGQNMNAKEIKNLLNNFKLMVTFNGACFDLPIIRRYFNNVVPDIPHLDLRFAGAKAGLNGGLKLIEKQVGIKRPDEVEDVTGFEALRLWEAYRHSGNEKFRDILLQYNAEDILNLKPLANIVYDLLQKKMKKRLKRSNV